MNPRRLYRCRSDRKIAGVAAGMAEYLEVDPTVVRILWILSAFIGGFSILLYIVLAFVIPIEPTEAVAYGPVTPAGTEPVEGAPGQPVEGLTGATAAPHGYASSPAGMGMPAHLHAHGPASGDQRGGSGGWLIVGVLLVVFGGLAFLGEIVPGWASTALGPGFVLALGVALIVGAMRRQAVER